VATAADRDSANRFTQKDPTAAGRRDEDVVEPITVEVTNTVFHPTDTAALAQTDSRASSILWPLIGYYPHRIFRRLVIRRVERRDAGMLQLDYRGWTLEYPDVGRWFRQVLVEQASKFNDPELALPACVTWARYFGGGNQAWRQFALVFKRMERREERLRAWVEGKGEYFSSRADAWRHDLEDHGRLSEEEAAAMDRQLEHVGLKPISPIPRGHWWQAGDPDAWRHPSIRGRLLFESATASSDGFCDTWTDADVGLYGDLLARVPVGLREAAAAEVPLQRDVVDALLARSTLAETQAG
jgi:hypothetical protein